MRQFNRITIIGVGLIGGSIGLAIKKKRLAKEVVGVFRRRSTLKKALKRGAVDKGVMNIKDGVEKADLIIVASPVLSIPKLVSEAAKYSKRRAIITDVGSTKSYITGKIKKGIRFVGSHPMAGSEKTGVEFSRADLFDGSPCIVTDTGQTDKEALKVVVDFWKTLGAKVEVMDPEKHDKNAAFISHLPHVISFSLAGAAPEETLQYAAEGFRDTTRIASSDPLLWADIFLTNKKGLEKACSEFEIYFKKMKNAISGHSMKELIKLLKMAKAKRDKLK